MPRPLAFLVAAALAVAAPPLFAAQYYKWVDDEGVTHYSQQPPPESVATQGKAEATTLPASTPDAPPGGEAANGETEQGAAGADAEGEEAGDGPKTVAEFCERMRSEEETLAGDRPVRMKNDDGTLEPLEGEARQQRLQQVRGQLQQHCQGDDAG